MLGKSLIISLFSLSLSRLPLPESVTLTSLPQLNNHSADSFTFHVEATKDPKALINSIRNASRKMQVGVALKPKTSVDAVLEFANECDILLVMTVEPGFGGQKFMVPMMEKVKRLRELYPEKDIQVDGGLGPSPTDAAAAAGANMIVAGSSIFKSNDRAVVIKQLRDSVIKYGHGVNANV